MTAVDFTLADVQAIDRVLRILNRLDELLDGPSPNRDQAYDRLDALSDRMLMALDDQPLAYLADTDDHSKAAEFRLVRGGGA